MSKRRELVERRRQQERRQTRLLLGIIVAVSVVIVGGAVLISAAQNPQSAQPAAIAVTKAPPANLEPNGRAWGPADAPIKILEFIDYQCPSCGVQATRYEQGIVDAFAGTGKVRYEIHNLAFIGPESRTAAAAALCAAEQNRFWDMHASIFANLQGENRGALTQDRLAGVAEQLGLDMGAFNTCMSSGRVDETLKADSDLANQLGVNSTPSFVVNGKVYSGVRTAEDLRRIAAELAPEVKLSE